VKNVENNKNYLTFILKSISMLEINNMNSSADSKECKKKEFF